MVFLEFKLKLWFVSLCMMWFDDCGDMLMKSVMLNIYVIYLVFVMFESEKNKKKEKMVTLSCAYTMAHHKVTIPGITLHTAKLS